VDVLITGAAGKIGVATGNAFVAKGWRVVGYDLRPNAAAKFPIRVEDLVTSDQWTRDLDGTEVLVHLAGHSDAGSVPDAQLLAENDALNAKAFRAAVRGGVRKILFASSCQVSNGAGARGSQESPLAPAYLPLDGSAPARPRNAYARSKFNAERLLSEIAATAPSLSAFAFRLPWVIGPEELNDALWYRTALRFYRDAFTFLTVDDAAALFLAAAHAGICGYRCYYPAAGENLLLWTPEKVRRRFFAETPCRAKVPLTTLVELGVLRDELNWEPGPLPGYAGLLAPARRLRVLASQQFSALWPSGRRKWREAKATLGRSIRRYPAPRGEAQCLIEARALHGESAIWDSRSGSFCWVDLDRGHAYRTPASGGANAAMEVPDLVAAIVPAAPDGFWIVQRHAIGWIDFDRTETKTPIRRIEGPPNRFNDAKCDSAGRLWLSSMHVDGNRCTGTLFCLHLDGTLERKLEALACPNGPAWSPDNSTLYLIDSARGTLDAYDFDVTTASLRNRRTCCAFPRFRGRPDGLCVDQLGLIWVAIYGGGCVVRIDPRAHRVVECWKVPTRWVTSCALGGPDGRTLFITTGRDPENPSGEGRERFAGGVFVLRSDAPGVVTHAFAGDLRVINAAEARRARCDRLWIGQPC
jgi:sugar lactone lactonase YvrE/nucleoside-diphosphate-sugar epimerase